MEIASMFSNSRRKLLPMKPQNRFKFLLTNHKSKEGVSYLDGILILVYVFAAWWAYGVVFANYIRVGTFSNLFLSKLIVSVLAGLVLIPIAIIKKLIKR